MPNISMETTLPWQLLEFLKYGQSFLDHANFRQKLISVNFSADFIAHMLRMIKNMIARNGMFFIHPINPKIRKLTLTSFVPP